MIADHFDTYVSHSSPQARALNHLIHTYIMADDACGDSEKFVKLAEKEMQARAAHIELAEEPQPVMYKRYDEAESAFSLAIIAREDRYRERTEAWNAKETFKVLNMETE